MQGEVSEKRLIRQVQHQAQIEIENFMKCAGHRKTRMLGRSLNIIMFNLVEVRIQL